MAADEVIGEVGGLQKIAVVSAIVWDGAPSHRDAVVQGLGLPQIGLPPHSPELNPAERVFEELRRATDGKVYATLEDKVAAVEKRLGELEADPERVRSLANWDWIQAAVNRLPARHAA
jgi:transposase